MRSTFSVTMLLYIPYCGLSMNLGMKHATFALHTSGCSCSIRGAPSSFWLAWWFECCVQGTHTTRVERYNDTLNFAVYKTSATESKVTAFSISNVGGALGDEGETRV